MTDAALPTITIAAIRVATDDVDGATALFSTICGQPSSGDGERRLVPVGTAVIAIEPLGDHPRAGVIGVDLTGGDTATTQLLNGIEVTMGANPGGPNTPADVVLDHLAIAVHDLEAAAQRWQAVTGAPAEIIGLHPISNGTMRAARLTVGQQMLELLAPVAGTTSGMATRLQQRGEGPMALALPAIDLDRKRAELEAAGHRLLSQDPHWLVHPANPAGVLVQLTPRVAH